MTVEEFAGGSEEVVFLLEADRCEGSLLLPSEAAGAEIELFIWPVSSTSTETLPVGTADLRPEALLAGGVLEPVEVATLLCSVASEAVLLPEVLLSTSETFSVLLASSSAAQVRSCLKKASVSNSRGAELLLGDVGAGTADTELVSAVVARSDEVAVVAVL